MTKILVLYHSNTTNSQRMAELVAEGAQQLDDAEVRLRSIEEADHTDRAGTEMRRGYGGGVPLYTNCHYARRKAYQRDA